MSRVTFGTGTTQEVLHSLQTWGQVEDIQNPLTEQVCTVPEQSGAESIWTCSFPHLCLLQPTSHLLSCEANLCLLWGGGWGCHCCGQV